MCRRAASVSLVGPHDHTRRPSSGRYSAGPGAVWHQKRRKRRIESPHDWDTTGWDLRMAGTATSRLPPYHRLMPNRLAGETSPYLLQHANNPVDWFPWGPDALARAKLLDRPIFLSIGYAACHWCHVMERESFEHEATARYLNDQFISIKVDREERPDLDQLYMGAVQAMTGGGGWPMSVFLTPEGKPVLRRHVLPRRAAPRDAVLPPGPRGRRPNVARPARRGRRRRQPAGRRRSSTQQRLEASTDDPTPALFEAVASGLMRLVRLAQRQLGRARRSSPSR